MYLTLLNDKGFPYASVYCDHQTLDENFEDLFSLVEKRGYKKPFNITISEGEEWKNIPGFNYLGTNYSNGEAVLHIYKANNGFLLAVERSGVAYRGSDMPSLFKNMNKEGYRW